MIVFSRELSMAIVSFVKLSIIVTNNSMFNIVRFLGFLFVLYRNHLLQESSLDNKAKTS